MRDPPRPSRWWLFGLFGGLALTLATLLGAPLKIAIHRFRSPAEQLEWSEIPRLAILTFAMGFLCGLTTWFLRSLPARLGVLGDALTGVLVMLVFFLLCMYLFEPSMLVGHAPGRGAMLLLGAAAGLILGPWIGRDLRAP